MCACVCVHYHLSQKDLQVSAPQRSAAAVLAETCSVFPPWCRWCVFYPRQPGRYWLPAANQGSPPERWRQEENTHVELPFTLRKNINLNLVNLWSRHFIGGQGDDALYLGVADLLYLAARNQLDRLKNHNSVCHRQLNEQWNKQERGKMRS